jgi:putative spermidine/putrescine transport system ATP-binding protein
MTVAVLFSKVSRHYGLVKALDEVDLEVQEGEFFAMLGPSGSGKTTCLRQIAGFEQPTSGHIEIFGETAEGVPPFRRNVNTVFQDYALFPHLNVLDNVAYGLMIRGIDKTQRYRSAEAALDLVALPGLGKRRAGELSGGQRQRVALARALVNKPRVLLLDEPLGALDLKLREQMQEELKALHKRLGITFIFVTHDQNEALSMADRVALFDQGRIVQVGTPQDIYRRPNSRFVADFVGSSNLLPPDFVATLVGSHQWASLRPEVIRLAESSGHEARVVATSFMGGSTRLTLDLGALRIHALLPSISTVPEVGERIHIDWEQKDLHLMEEGV